MVATPPPKKSTFWPWFPIHSFRQFLARTYRFATIQNVTDRQTTDRHADDTDSHSVPKARQIVRSAKNWAASRVNEQRCPIKRSINCEVARETVQWWSCHRLICYEMSISQRHFIRLWQVSNDTVWYLTVLATNRNSKTHIHEFSRWMVVISSTAFNSDIRTVVGWYSGLIFLQLSVMTLYVSIHDNRWIHKVK